ncbi:MAG TPA: VgrG-related protein [Candidatus Dormibacteraeota bacterium]|nr:VgrG-related protein [Candidatus Dormibacteraeota bacterium]
MAEPFHAWPDISIDGSPLSDQVSQQLEQVLVEHHQHLPDMFVISFHDPGRDILGQAGAKVGSTVVIKVTPPGGSSPETLINGEITSREAHYHAHHTRSLIRGYDKSHRMHRGRRTETYKNVTDSDIAQKVAQRAGLTIGQIDSTSGTFDLVSQANQSDWDFLKSRAREIGYELTMEDGKFYFRQPKQAANAPSTGDFQNHSDPLQLVSGDDLIELQVRVTSAEQVNDVKVRGWDPDQKQVVIGSANAGTVAASSLPDDPASLANTFGGPTFTAVNRPLAKQPEVDAAAKAIAEAISSAYAEADGIALGNPKLKAGSTVSLGVVGDEFAGKYTLTSARHVFAEGGYRTHFAVNGRQDRTLLGLTSLGSSNGHASAGGAPINGVVVAVVTDNNDPNNLARVKLKFPWLDDNYESDWARLAQLGAGPNSGVLWIPEVNDEVLVAFEHGDIRRPYVVGQLYNGQDKPNEGSGLFDNGKVKRRGFISRKGHKFIFFDDDNKKGVAILSEDGNYKISLNETTKEIHIKSSEKITVESGKDMTLKSGADLNLEAQQGLTVKAGAKLTLKGSQGGELDGGAQLDVKASGQISVDGMFSVNSGALMVTK